MEKKQLVTTGMDLEMVDEPCKTCSLMVFDEGGEKTFYCNDKMAPLVLNADTKKFSRIPYCMKGL